MHFTLRLGAVLATLCLSPVFVVSQVIFQETFNEPSGSTMGSDNGVNWSSSCPSCLTGDYWEVNNGVFEGNDTNGEAAWMTDDVIDISSCGLVEVSFDIQSVGTMEACGTGCNSADWVRFQYNVDGTGWTDPSNSYFCSGPCAGFNVIADDDFSGTYSTGCLPLNGNNLQIRVSVQCWSGNEYWQIDNITVTCGAANAGLNGSTSMCEGTGSVDLFNVLSGAPDAGGTWTGPSNLTGGDLGTFNSATMSAGQYTYTVGTGSCTASATVDVVVLPTPVVNAGTDTTLCFGNGISLNASGALNYLWDNGLGNGASHTVSPTNSTVYSVTGTDVNGCSSTDQVSVSVNQLPTPVISGSSTYCSGSSSNLSLTNGYSTYAWSTGGTTSTMNATALNNPISVTVTDAAGCTGTSGNFNVTEVPSITTNSTIEICEGQIATIHGSSETQAGVYSQTFASSTGCDSTSNVTLVVKVTPFINAGTDQNLCDDGSQVTLQATGAATFSWDNGVQDGVPFDPGIGSHTYTVTTVGQNGCIGADQVNVTVNPLPVVDAGADQTICAGDAIVLNAAGASSYMWDNGVVNGVSFVPTASNTYSVIGTDLNGCVGTDQIVVNVEELPSLSFEGDILTGCAPLDVTFTNTTVGNFTDASWAFGNGETMNSLGMSSTSYESSGTYSVTLSVTTASGCTVSKTYVDYIFIENKPVASFIPSTTLINSFDSQVSFNNTSVGAETYVWDFGDGAQSNVEDPIHVYDVGLASNYTVELVAIAETGCTDTVEVDLIAGDELIYYIPNAFTPDGDEFNQTFQPVFTEGFDPFDYTLLIFNRWGEVVFESHDVNIGWDGTYPSSTTIPSGMFTWRVEFKTLASDKRVVDTGHVSVLR